MPKTPNVLNTLVHQLRRKMQKCFAYQNIKIRCQLTKEHQLLGDCIPDAMTQ